MIIRDNLPMKFIESPRLRALLKLFVNHKTHSAAPVTLCRNSLALKMDAMLERAESCIVDTFKKYKNMVSLTTDIWTSKPKVPFATFTVHWVDEEQEKLKAIVISWENLLYPHDGPSLQDRERNICDKFMITQKIFAKTSDSASNNVRANAITKIKRSTTESPLSDINVLYCRPHRLNTCAQRFWNPKKKLLINVDDVVKLKKAELAELKRKLS